jgi:hypothetical protein
MPTVSPFAVGQYVELYPTIPSSRGGSVLSGTRGIVLEVAAHGGDMLYLVQFLTNESRSGEQAWLAAGDLLPA